MVNCDNFHNFPACIAPSNTDDQDNKNGDTHRGSVLKKKPQILLSY
jgi:hypothetical protein